MIHGSLSITLHCNAVFLEFDSDYVAGICILETAPCVLISVHALHAQVRWLQPEQMGEDGREQKKDNRRSSVMSKIKKIVFIHIITASLYIKTVLLLFLSHLLLLTFVPSQSRDE